MLIRNGCVTLRAIEESDLELLHIMINEPDIENMTGGWNPAIGRMEKKQWMASYKNTDKNMRLMIELTNGKTIGMIMLTDIDWKNRKAAMGFKLHASAEDRIKGDLYDASAGIVEYAFNELGMNRLEGYIVDDNVFSIKMSKKLGFQQEGILRERIYKGGRYHDQIILALLKKDYQNKQI